MMLPALAFPFVLAAEAANSSAATASPSSSAAATDPATAALLAAVTIFTLAIFVGVEIITKIPPTLHTPLMSGSNAISGITIVGAILAAGGEDRTLAVWLGFLAVTLATVNVVGGFLVTHRMLQKFRR
jgi:NAD(P) transhydrogenase subunit alpha